MKRWAACTLAVAVQLLILVAPAVVMGEAGRLLKPAVLVLLGTLSVSLLAEASVAEETRLGSQERSSRWLAQGTGAALLLLHVLAVCGLGDSGVSPSSGVVLAFGAAAVLLGGALRRWSVRTLGRDFRTGWTVRGQQPLVTTGPFAWSRHPSELGLLVAAAGVVVLSANPACAIVAVGVLGPLTAARIGAEEAALRRGFGAAYARYAAGTPVLFGWPLRRPTIRTM